MKTLLISMSRADTVYGTHPVHYALLSGRRVLTHGQGQADEARQWLGRSLRVSLDSPANLTERLRVRALSRRFVPVLVQRQLTDTGAYTERFRARSRTNWLRQGEAEVDVQAMLEDDAELAHELLPTETIPLTHLLTAEAAVAALVGTVTPQAVLVHWWHTGSLRTLGVRQGRVVWHRSQPFGMQGAGAVGQHWKTWLDTATTTAPLEFSGTHGLVLRMGPGPWADTGDWASNGSRELLGRIERLFQGVALTDVMAQPQLYGLAFAGHSDTLIVNGYRQRVMAWHATPLLAGLAAAAGTISLAMGLWWHQQAQHQWVALRADQAVLERQTNDVKKMLPPGEAVQALRAAAWRETALGANLRTDRFLNELLQQMPRSVHIRRLHIARNGTAAERVRVVDGQPALDLTGQSPRRRNEAMAQKRQQDSTDFNLVPAAAKTPAFAQVAPVRRMPVNGEPSFMVDLDIQIAGGYARGKLEAEKLAERLSLLGRLSNTQLTFEDSPKQEAGARLNTRLTIAAGAF